MTSSRRWAVVAALVLLVVGVPLGWQARPAGDPAVGAAELLSRVRASEGRGYSGYVETTGTLQLPVTDRFTDIGALFGESNRLRVWWRSADHWRVDRLLTTGETDLVHDLNLTTEWDYERGAARRSVDPGIRLPRTADLLPTTLAHRLLDDVDAAQVTRVPAVRVAGRDAPGLRLEPGSRQSSIDHVDLWADPDTGLPLAVEVYDAADVDPVFSTRFRELSTTPPDRSRTRFAPPPGADVSFEEVLDIADAADQFAPFVPPVSLAGLARSASSRGAVGVYGAGLTQVLAIPLWSRAADPLREQLTRTPGVRSVDEGTVLRVGPLGVLLTDRMTGEEGYGGGWLLTGTVTDRTLLTAADDLLAGARYDEGRYP
ncbi:hypothetical protein ACT8ZV_19300 [Nocardioides sp. MAHUQ-72]|uniref:hypothetical protein n=1 Tax=unclassified Nocardioides TaxID=2615069 RepID=UPI0036195BC0